MSKFIDILNQKSRGGIQSIGFTARASTSPQVRIKLVASLAAESVDSLSARAAGADAGIIVAAKAAAGAEALKKVSTALPGTHWGGMLLNGTSSGMKQLGKAGVDFLVLSAGDSPAGAFEEKETGRILAIEASLDEGLLRAVNELPLQAVLVSGSQPVTWQSLMLFRRFADLLTRPLLVTVSPQITGIELIALWEAGVRGVVVDIDEKLPEGRLNKIREEIDKLEFPAQYRSDRREAVLPSTGKEARTAARESEEEEDD